MKPKSKNTGVMIGVAVAAYLFCIVWAVYAANLMDQNTELAVLPALLQALTQIGQPFTFQFNNSFLRAIGAVTLVYAIAAIFAYIEYEREKNTLPGKEEGTAKWLDDYNQFNKHFNEPYDSTNNDGPHNLILSKEMRLGMDQRTRLNLNALVVGGSGSGKSRFYVKPNLLQLNSDCSYVVTDPSGELLAATGDALKEHGYKIKIFNLVDMRHSNTYNPFEYIRSDEGVMMLINCLIKNTTPAGAGKGDPFWEKSEIALLEALVFYLIKYRPKEEQNFSSVMKLLRAAEVDENNPNAKSALDKLFDEVERQDPNSIALKQYKTFKMGAGKTLKSILISCAVRLTVFNLEQIENLTRIDTMELGKIGDEKMALFVILPQADDTYNFLASMMYSQLFETLYFHAENECEGKKLPHLVLFFLDEFANIGQIPDFEKKLSTMRKYNMGVSIILQNLAQLKLNYKDNWETMVGNCDSLVFLGGQEVSTLEYFSKLLGKTTIRARGNSRSMGGRSSSSLSYNSKGRDLMTPDELRQMHNQNCLVILRGQRPSFSHKYDYPKHPNYKLTGDANPENLFDYHSYPEYDNAPRITVSELQTTIKEERAEDIISKPKPVIDGIKNKIKEEQKKEESETPTTPSDMKKDKSEGITNGVSSIRFQPISQTKASDDKREEKQEEQEQEEWSFSTF